MLKTINLYFLSFLLLACISSNSVLAQSPKKTAYSILLDNSGSLTKQFPDVLLLSKAAIKRIHQRGPISLFNFKTEDTLAVIVPGLEWSTDDIALNSYIDNLLVVTGHTALLEAIQSMAEALEAKVNSDKESFGDKVIILITDGEDRIRRSKGMSSSRQGEDDERRKVENKLIKKLKENGVKVYAIGLTRELDADRPILMGPSDREKAENFLKKIAKETGGRTVIPKSKKIDIDSLINELFAQ